MKLNLVFFHDPGHGWLRVPKSFVDLIGVEVSPYSYLDPRDGMAYLEEDLDAPRFLVAVKDKGWEVVTTDKHLGSEENFIRDLDCFVFVGVKQPFASNPPGACV
jgi:hypothetical protein